MLGRLLAGPENLRLAERARADHTWSHQVPFGSNDAPDAIERELEATERLIGPLAHRKRWFRPFGSGGALDARLLSSALVDHLVAHRYSCVLWNAVPRDWETPDACVPIRAGKITAPLDALIGR